MKEYMMALDQGTTSSRCILFDKMGNIRAKAQKEFAKIALDGLTVEAMIWISAIIISFGCYLPVTLFSKTKPKVGLLMIPKTCAYMWIIAMGLQLLF